MTLDGLMEAPGGEDSLGERSGWSIPFFSEETAKFKLDELLASDALLMGRVTYQIHAAAWPSMTDEEGFADRMNSQPKYVVSTTLERVEWNNSRLIRGNIPEEVKKLKQEVQRNILIDGGSDLVNVLMQHDLIDEYRLLVHPVVVGKGKRLFREGSQKKEFRLVEARALGTGVVALTYQPAETKN
jgi:dihydrofolate reductase